MTARRTGAKTFAALAASAALAIMLACAATSAETAYADSAQTRLTAGSAIGAQSTEGSITKGSLTVSSLTMIAGSLGIVDVFSDNYSNSASIGISVSPNAGETITVTSSNPSIAAPWKDEASFTMPTWSAGTTAHIYVKGVGSARITISNGTDSITVPFVSYPWQAAKIKSVKRGAYNKVRVTWTPISGVTGYEIQRATVDSDGYPTSDYTTVARVTGAAKKSAAVAAKWGKSYDYAVMPYVKKGKTLLIGKDIYERTRTFALPEPKATITSVAKAGASSLEVSWEAYAGASRFQILRSVNENYGYKVIATKKAPAAKSATGKITATYKDKKVKKNTTYYYRVRAVYPGRGTVVSASCGQMIPKKTSVLRRSISTAAGPSRIGKWQVDDLYYYVLKGKVHIVYYDYRAGLLDYTLNSALNITATKTIKLPKNTRFESFYHGPDGNNYVALGYGTHALSKNKTAIQIVKYNSAWKKSKATSIKSGFALYGIGIFTGASMDMQGRTLHLCADYIRSGGDYQTKDSLSFSCLIDTKTMKVAGGPHSFGPTGTHIAYARAKDDCAYQIYSERTTYGNSVILKGTDADGATILKTKLTATHSGMEVGTKNILTCGASQNAYVTVTNLATGKTKVKRLTSMQSDTQVVDEICMVKITDSRFGVLFSVLNNKTGKITTRYIVVDGTGKKVLSRSYNNMEYSGNTQPVLANGCICWLDKPRDKGSVSWQDTTSDTRQVMYRIPAL